AQHRQPQRIHVGSLLRDRAHLQINKIRQLEYVIAIAAPQVVSLIVDLYSHAAAAAVAVLCHHPSRGRETPPERHSTKDFLWRWFDYRPVLAGVNRKVGSSTSFLFQTSWRHWIFG